LYAAAFWVVLFGIANGALAVIRAVINPDWYQNERIKEGLRSDIFDSGKQSRNMIITKVVVILVLSLAAWHIGQKAGYL
jgi:hypothetical protein